MFKKFENCRIEFDYSFESSNFDDKFNHTDDMERISTKSSANISIPCNNWSWTNRGIINQISVEYTKYWILISMSSEIPIQYQACTAGSK